MSNISLNENVSIVLGAMARCALPHQFAIAGGFVRDSYHGVMPKDIDVLAVGEINSSMLVIAMAEHGYALDVVDGASGEQSTWRDVYQFSCPGKLDVDVLVSYQPDLLTAVDTFDCNLNQYMLLPNNTQLYAGNREGVLRFIPGADVSAERRAYIEQKARDLGWIVPVTPTAEEA